MLPENTKSEKVDVFAWVLDGLFVVGLDYWTTIMVVSIGLVEALTAFLKPILP